MGRSKRALIWLAMLPTRPAAGWITMALLLPCALLTAYVGARPIGAGVALYGLVITLHGFGMVTDWGGIRTENSRNEAARVGRARKRPLGRTGAGKLYLAATRTDLPIMEGLAGFTGVTAGPVLIVVGTLIVLGVLRP